VLTWLDRARRDELSTVPGDNPASPPLAALVSWERHTLDPMARTRSRFPTPTDHS
jgi:hypothetical protein